MTRYGKHALLDMGIISDTISGSEEALNQTTDEVSM